MVLAGGLSSTSSCIFYGIVLENKATTNFELTFVHQALQYLQKSHRCSIQSMGWEKDLDKCKSVAEEACSLAKSKFFFLLQHSKQYMTRSQIRCIKSIENCTWIMWWWYCSLKALKQWYHYPIYSCNIHNLNFITHQIHVASTRIYRVVVIFKISHGVAVYRISMRQLFLPNLHVR